jgi:hypothetical protein
MYSQVLWNRNHASGRVSAIIRAILRENTELSWWRLQRRLLARVCFSLFPRFAKVAFLRGIYPVTAASHVIFAQ